MGRGEQASQKQRNSARIQRPKARRLVECGKGTWRSHVPFPHFGGRGGTGPPTQKKGGLRRSVQIIITTGLCARIWAKKRSKGAEK